MDLNIQITDMAGAYIEHSMVITNFCTIVSSQLKNNMCRVFPDNVQYKWHTKSDLGYDESENPKYHLWKTITEENKGELKILHFPHIKIDFDELFNIEW